jgi:hypothetical protein
VAKEQVRATSAQEVPSSRTGRMMVKRSNAKAARYDVSVELHEVQKFIT